MKPLLTRPAWTKSIRFQITFWYVTTLTLILLVAGGLLYWGLHAALLRSTDAALATEATQIIHLITDPQETAEVGETPDRPNAALIVERSSFPPMTAPVLVTEAFYVRLADSHQGTTVAVSGNLRREPELLAALSRLPAHSVYAFAGFTEEDRLRCLTVAVPKQPYFLQIGTPWDHIEDLLTSLIAGIGILILLFLILSGVGSWVLVGRTLAPIDGIVTEAERLTAERLAPLSLGPRTIADNEVGHLVKALNGMIDRLHTTFAMQRQFTADASHELRTPLTILHGEIELALTREREVTEYQNTLHSALEEVQRLTRIVESLSLLARNDSDAARAPTAGQRFSLTDLVAEVSGNVMRQARDQGVQLSILHTDEIVSVLGDRDRLYVVIRNLLDNAIRYTPSGGKITVSTVVSSQEMELSVTDTGVGIAPDDLTHVFDRFFRADKARVNSGGSGLGLSIAQSIVQTYGGRITVTSILGEGSTFTVYLPKDK